MIKEVVLRDFPNWTPEKQLSEFQAYKKLGGFSPFSEADYALMEMVMNNPNAEISVQCEDGVCGIVKDELDECLLEIDETLLEKYVMNPQSNATTITLLKLIYSDIKKNKDKHPEMHTLKLILNNIYRMSMTSNDVYAAASEKTMGLLLDIMRYVFTGIKPIYFKQNLFDNKGNDGITIMDTFNNALGPEEVELIFKGINDTYIRTFFKTILTINHENLIKEYQPIAVKMESAKAAIKTKINNVSTIISKQLEDTQGTATVKEIIVSTEFMNSFKSKVETMTGRMNLDYNKSKFLYNYLENNFDSLTPEILIHFNSLIMTEENIKNFKSTNYSDEFFANLFKYEEVRQFGKGEILLEFIFDGASINGASESFDLNVTKGSLLGKTQLEVKVYDAPRDIAIGTTGKISRYPIFSDVTRLLKQILVILKNEDLLRGLKDNMVKYSDLITDKFTIDALDELHQRMEQASVPSKFFEYFDEITPKIKHAFITLLDNKLSSANVVKINDKYVTFNDTTTLNIGETLEIIDVSTEDKDNVALRETIKLVMSHPYMKGNNTMLGNGGKLSEALVEINKKFTNTPMILIVKSGTGFYVDGIHTEFEFTRVSLGEIKISPKSS